MTTPTTNRVARKRSHTTARQAGARFERECADYLKAHMSRFIDRRVKTGANDQGDLVNVETFNQKSIAVECKNESATKIGPHLKEAEVERLNLGAVAGVVIAKRHGVGDIGKQVVLMQLDDFIAIATGVRP